MSIITLIKAFRTNENTVKVIYLHNERRQEFVIEWNNIHQETGKECSYDLQIDCLSRSEELNELVEECIKAGETDSNPNLDLYYELRDTFGLYDCIDMASA